MKRALLHFVLFSYSACLYLSCATQQPVTGGFKDTIPPTLIETIPTNKSLNTTSSQITLIFDENIKEDQIQSKLIITPDDQNKFETTTRKNKITLLFEKEFLDSTTYTINFNNSIEDITEGNEAENIIFAFSTTSYIDSLSIAGFSQQLLTAQPVEDVTIALYQANDTSHIFNKRPLYFTKTQKDGSFKLDNLKSDTYRLYAFLDANKNNLCEPDAEPHGFIADTLVLSASIDSLTIPIIRNDVRPLAYLSARASGQYFEVRYNKPLKTYSVDFPDSLATPWSVQSSLTEDARGIIFYPLSNPKKDSLLLQLMASDSSGNIAQSEAYLKFEPSRRSLNKPTVTISPNTDSQITESVIVNLSFNKPILFQSIDDSVRITIDTLLRLPIRPDSSMWQSYNNSATLNLQLPKNLVTEQKTKLQTVLDSISADTASTKYQEVNSLIAKWSKVKDNYTRLTFPYGTFITVDNDTLPTQHLSYSFINPEERGIVSGSISANYNSFFVQLINTKFEVISTLTNTRQFQFKNVPPGDYTIRVLIDNNNDGAWSPGNSLLRIPPEDVFIYPTPFNVRANWTMENIDVSF